MAMLRVSPTKAECRSSVKDGLESEIIRLSKHKDVSYMYWAFECVSTMLGVAYPTNVDARGGPNEGQFGQSIMTTRNACIFNTYYSAHVDYCSIIASWYV